MVHISRIPEKTVSLPPWLSTIVPRVFSMDGHSLRLDGFRQSEVETRSQPQRESSALERTGSNATFGLTGHGLFLTGSYA